MIEKTKNILDIMGNSTSLRNFVQKAVGKSIFRDEFLPLSFSVFITPSLVKRLNEKDLKDWCLKEWGCIDEAYDAMKNSGKVNVQYTFTTHYMPPLFVIAEMSSQFPDLDFSITFIIEDVENNFRIRYTEGKIRFRNRRIVASNIELPEHFKRLKEQVENAI